MDVRDVVKQGIHYPQALLPDMFRLQKVLIDHYVGIEGLPSYPINIHTKESQSLIKDFSGRIIEELGESYESLQMVLYLYLHGKSREEMIPHLQNFNEEVSDALHFWLELMIFSGYELDHIEKWLTKDMEFSKTGCLLTEWLNLGNTNNDIRFYMAKPKSFEVIKDKDLGDREYLRGGRKISIDIINRASLLLWDITYYQQMVRNTLKNKPWKQTGVITDMGQYEMGMKNTCLAIFSFLSFMQFTPESVYSIYYYKNKVNQFRIQSKY